MDKAFLFWSKATKIDRFNFHFVLRSCQDLLPLSQLWHNVSWAHAQRQACQHKANFAARMTPIQPIRAILFLSKMKSFGFLLVYSVFLWFFIEVLFRKSVYWLKKHLNIQLELSKVLAQQSPNVFVCQNIRYHRNLRSRSEIQASKHVSKVRKEPIKQCPAHAVTSPSQGRCDCSMVCRENGGPKCTRVVTNGGSHKNHKAVLFKP